MAFDANNMTLSSHGQGGNPVANLLLTLFGRGSNPRRWCYKTTDGLVTVIADGYFASFANLQIGDFIDVVYVDHTEPALRTTSDSVQLRVMTL